MPSQVLSPCPSLRVLATALLLIAALVLAAPAHATTADDPAVVTWTVVPATADGPDGRVSLRHVADPGSVIHDAVAVQNLGPAPVDLTVGTGDGVVGADGAFDVKDAQYSASWITLDGLDSPTVHVEAGQTQVLPVTITVPPGATPGDHPAGIVVGVSTTDAGSVLTHRIGVRVHLQVTGELTPRMTTQIVETRYRPSANPFAPGRLTVEYAVTNTGNTRWAAVPSLEITGPLGLGAGTVFGDAVELLPGDTRSESLTVAAWPLVVATGEVRAAPIAIGADTAPLPTAAVAEVRATVLSWTVSAILLALVTTLTVGIRARRRRARASTRNGRTTTEWTLERVSRKRRGGDDVDGGASARDHDA